MLLTSGCRPPYRKLPTMWLNRLWKKQLDRTATRCCRLSVERLEGRDVPSTLTVLNNLDSGAGSLRYAIGHSHDGDAIVFDAALAGRTITLTSGSLDVKRSLDIEGPGAGLLAVSGNDAIRVFAVSEGLDVTIAGLTITHGRVG